MNVTVINGKDLLKYGIGLVAGVVIIASATNLFNANKKIDNIKKVDEQTRNNIEFFKNASLVSIFNITMPFMMHESYIEKNAEEAQVMKKSTTDKILGVNLAMMNQVEKKIESNELIVQNEQQNEEEKEIEVANTDVSTTQVTENNITPSYTNEYGSVQIKNQSSCEITNDLFETTYEMKNAKDVLIYHTHTCESYTPSEGYQYESTGTYRTTDLNYSVARVGTELTSQLEHYGYNVIHDTTYHDYPAYNGSYDRSQETVKNILSNNSGVQTVIDLHRDAVGNGNDYGPSVLIGDESVAQLMIVLRDKWRRTMASKLETEFQISSNDSRKSK